MLFRLLCLFLVLLHLNSLDAARHSGTTKLECEVCPVVQCPKLECPKVECPKVVVPKCEKRVKKNKRKLVPPPQHDDKEPELVPFKTTEAPLELVKPNPIPLSAFPIAANPDPVTASPASFVTLRPVSVTPVTTAPSPLRVHARYAKSLPIEPIPEAATRATVQFVLPRSRALNVKPLLPEDPLWDHEYPDEQELAELDRLPYLTSQRSARVAGVRTHRVEKAVPVSFVQDDTPENEHVHEEMEGMNREEDVKTREEEGKDQRAVSKKIHRIAKEEKTPDSSNSLSGLDTIVADVSLPSKSAPSDENVVPVVSAGYMTNPRFASEIIKVDRKKCNDHRLLKVLVEGMEVNDVAGSKSSIEAILSARNKGLHTSNVSVLCSEKDVSFRLVTKNYCQLSAGTATCLLFTF